MFLLLSNLNAFYSYFFFCLTSLATTHHTVLNRSAGSRHSFLVLILVEMVSVFHHWVWCSLWVFHIWHSLCWDSCISSLLSVFVMKGCWILSCFFLHQLRWSCSFFPHPLIYVACYIAQFSHVKPSLQSRNKSHLVMVHNPFNMLLNSIC